MLGIGNSRNGIKKGDIMRTIITLLVTICFVIAPMATFAGKGYKGGSKGPSEKAYQNADENAKFKRQGEMQGPADVSKEKKRERYEKHEGKSEMKGKTEKKRVGQEEAEVPSD
jgi:hypothetical protein